MENPSSTTRRRAWINSSRQGPTLEEPGPGGPPPVPPSASMADDDVFSDGCFTGKIENWLLGCGSEKSSQRSFESVLKPNNLDDELSLGADASLLNVGENTLETDIAQHPTTKQGSSRATSTPRRRLCLPSLNLGHSMASSYLSSSTCTSSTVSEILQLCSEDAEETLYELGFGRDEPQVTVRIPPRFLHFPSLSQGINFRVFLDSQLQRIREEDPSLSLASRFRQVQVLTSMANAFYSLYSHVSRTPVQKLATPEFTFSSSPAERIDRFRSTVRSEPRSPVERLKDTVSKMCLYTGSPRGSDSTSPQPSPGKRSSLGDVVDIVLLKVKTGATEELGSGSSDWGKSAADVRLAARAEMPRDSENEAPARQAVADADVCHSASAIRHKEPKGSERTGNGDAGESRTRSEGTSLASLTEETAREEDDQFISYPRDTRTADLQPVAKITYDHICPQIVESVHQTLFCSQHTRSTKTNASPPSSPQSGSTGGARVGSHGPDAQSAFSESASRSLPALAANVGRAQCCITVTGWEGDNVSSTVPPVQAREETSNMLESRYLNPQAHRGFGDDSSNLQQANSFELEEVQSAGEEDLGQLETTRTATLQSKNHQYKGDVVRGDSMQSDSSGYADEEVSSSPNAQSR
ncbi:protein ITPRID2 [Pungitius pungitius]|uniref:protein ITPRID2 n=1 Tax=Pungitius pungitius TaxID=134920 RepID=UPI002E15400B